MGRAKNYCAGKNQDGSSCKNWAIRGSYYCSSHQAQTTQEDIERMKTVQNWSGFIIILIIVILFLISLMSGCEKQFFHWISH
jgi:hypothetical protein